MPKHLIPRRFNPSISFMGGGQLWMYSIGVGHYLYEHYDLQHIKFLASSAGCFAAVPLACQMDPYEWCKQDWGKCINHFNSRGVIGCLFDSQRFYYNLWNDYLPIEINGIPIHIFLTERLYVSVTHFPSLKNEIIFQFASRDVLINAIVASMCLPFAFMRDFPVSIEGVSEQMNEFDYISMVNVMCES